MPCEQLRARVNPTTDRHASKRFQAATTSSGMDYDAQDLTPLESTVRELQIDFEGTCLALASDIASANDPSELLDLVTALSSGHSSAHDRGEAAAETPETDEDEDYGGSDDTDGLRERVATLLVPQVAEILISRSFATTQCAKRVNAFFQHALVTDARYLPLPGVAEAAIPSLVAILDAHSPFYLYHSGQSNDPTSHDPATGSSEQGEDQATTTARSLSGAAWRFVRPDHSAYTCQFFLANLEFWGAAGGFSVFVEMLCGVKLVEPGESSPISDEGSHEHQITSLAFDAVQNVLRMIYNTKDYLRPEFLMEYLSPLSGGVAGWVERATSEELAAIPRDALLEFVHVLELMLAQVQQQCGGSRVAAWNDSTVNESADQPTTCSVEAVERRLHVLRLDILLAFFTSGSLEKRIYGFTEVIALVTRLYNSQVQEQEDPTASSLRLALSYLVDWMDRKRVMEELFGAKLHVELIKRSTPLFQFASELECLSPRGSIACGAATKAEEAATGAVVPSKQPTIRRTYSGTLRCAR